MKRVELGGVCDGVVSRCIECTRGKGFGGSNEAGGMQVGGGAVGFPDLVY